MPRAGRVAFAACLLLVAAHSDNVSAKVARPEEKRQRGEAAQDEERQRAAEERRREGHAVDAAEQEKQQERVEERQSAQRQHAEEEAQGEEPHTKEQHGEFHHVREPQGAERSAEDLESLSDHGGGSGEHEEPPGAEHGAEHAGGSAEHGEGLEEHEATPVDVAISSCLCGGVSLVMLLFYLVNYRDRDIRFYAWSIISSTISIFLSVLLYQGINTFITYYVVGFTSTGTWGLIGVAYSLMVGWMICLEVVMMFIADVFKLPECMTGNRHNMMQSWGRLCAHITGFASIRAGCALHHLHHGVATGPISAAGVVVAHSAVLAGLGLFFEWVRNGIARRRGVKQSRWLEEIVDAENDVSALSLSFLTVQVLRFAISGVLPNHEGLEEPQLKHSLVCSVQLFAAAAGFAVLVVVVVMLLSRESLPEGMGRRVLSVLQVTAAMACAWSIFFASKWELRRFFDTWDPNAMSARVVLALGVSGGAFSLIFVLDKLEDMDFTGRDVDRAIVSLISAMGILVGFSWEQSFEGAVGVFSALTPFPQVAELSIAFLTAVIVIPAWRNYILKSLVKSEACYLNNLTKKRTRDLSPEALELAMEAMNSTADLEIAPKVGRASSRSMMLAANGDGECSPNQSGGGHGRGCRSIQGT